ncbi:hypothetical protein O185_26925 [Photorhabdus temperata J3]|uniref:Uncharacterized protein n=1 Tax=Photorhabdus temperata J3 TaxID=1389415 RepID=U7QUT0_PHOTE|nr:hypothetical protein O185_26925 [Photorhabdus temperata J3]
MPADLVNAQQLTPDSGQPDFGLPLRRFINLTGKRVFPRCRQRPAIQFAVWR